MKYLKPLSLFRELQKTNALEQSRFLGLDVGDKYVGLAVSDSDNKITTPISVLLRKKSNIGLMANDFVSLISEFSLTGFIVGCPFDRQCPSADAAQVRVFIDDLCKTEKHEGVRYTYWNESYTSKNVELLSEPLTLHPVVLKTMLGKFAAVGDFAG
ncbi:hypothetical protein RND81_08G190600, partial [Saponaria officinalis]